MDSKTIILIILAVFFIVIVIPIIVVIALVVVGLFLQIDGNYAGVESSSANYTAWSMASPYAITNWSRTGSDLSIMLKNNSSDKLFLDSININGVESKFNFKEISPNASEIITITGLSDCKNGEKYVIQKEDIQIIFNRNSLSGVAQNGVADIVGKCN